MENETILVPRKKNYIDAWKSLKIYRLSRVTLSSYFPFIIFLFLLFFLVSLSILDSLFHQGQVVLFAFSILDFGANNGIRDAFGQRRNPRENTFVHTHFRFSWVRVGRHCPLVIPSIQNPKTGWTMLSRIPSRTPPSPHCRSFP